MSEDLQEEPRGAEAEEQPAPQLPAPQPAAVPVEQPEEAPDQEPQPEVIREPPDEPDAAPAPDEPDAAPAPTVQRSVDTASAWPFMVYTGLWAVFASLLIWRLLQTPTGMAAYESPQYPLFLMGGIGLTVAGPLLIAIVWFAAKSRARDRLGLFVSALYRGAVATTAGVALWWAALIVVDQIRLGRLF